MCKNGMKKTGKKIAKKNKKVVDNIRALLYNNYCVTEIQQIDTK